MSSRSSALPAARSVTETLAAVLHEAMEIVACERPEDPTARIRAHVLDRWYRFESFGVRSRGDLAPVRVVVSISRNRRRASTSVIVEGTPLEGQT